MRSSPPSSGHFDFVPASKSENSATAPAVHAMQSGMLVVAQRLEAVRHPEVVDDSSRVQHVFVVGIEMEPRELLGS